MAVEKPNVEQVRAIISTGLTDDQVQLYINDAALAVEGCISSLDDERQVAIVKWWTAHMIASAGQARGGGGGAGAVSSRKLGDASTTWVRGSLGTGAASTYYGQQAISLDPSGCLAKIGMERALAVSLSGP